MALLEIFGFLKDSAVHTAGEEGRGPRRVYALCKPGRKHGNLSHAKPAISQRQTFTAPRKYISSRSNLLFFLSLFPGKPQLAGRQRKKKKTPFGEEKNVFFFFFKFWFFLMRHKDSSLLPQSYPSMIGCSPFHPFSM